MPNEDARDVDYSQFRYVKPKQSGGVKKNNTDRNNYARSRKGKRTHFAVMKLDKQGLFVVVVMLICFGVTFLLAELLGGGIITLVSGAANSSESYYAVCIGTFTDESAASVCADELRRVGGAGYPMYEDKIYILASVYANKSDAEKVAGRLDSYTSFVYEIKIEDPSLDWCRTNDRKNVKSVLKYAEKSFEGLYSISVDMENGNISDDVAQSKINILHNEIDSLTSKLDNITVNSSNISLIRLRGEITAVLAMLYNLADGGLSRYNLISDVRYTYAAIIAGYKKLTGNI